MGRRGSRAPDKIRGSFGPRRDAGVVERGRLEICCALRGTGGSNPSLSASTFPRGFKEWQISDKSHCHSDRIDVFFGRAFHPLRVDLQHHRAPGSRECRGFLLAGTALSLPVTFAPLATWTAVRRAIRPRAWCVGSTTAL